MLSPLSSQIKSDFAEESFCWGTETESQKAETLGSRINEARWAGCTVLGTSPRVSTWVQEASGERERGAMRPRDSQCGQDVGASLDCPLSTSHPRAMATEQP